MISKLYVGLNNNGFSIINSLLENSKIEKENSLILSSSNSNSFKNMNVLNVENLNEFEIKGVSKVFIFLNGGENDSFDCLNQLINYLTLKKIEFEILLVKPFPFEGKKAAEQSSKIISNFNEYINKTIEPIELKKEYSDRNIGLSEFNEILVEKLTENIFSKQI